MDGQNVTHGQIACNLEIEHLTDFLLTLLTIYYNVDPPLGYPEMHSVSGKYSIHPYEVFCFKVTLVVLKILLQFTCKKIQPSTPAWLTWYFFSCLFSAAHVCFCNILTASGKSCFMMRSGCDGC